VPATSLSVTFKTLQNARALKPCSPGISRTPVAAARRRPGWLISTAQSVRRAAKSASTICGATSAASSRSSTSRAIASMRGSRGHAAGLPTDQIVNTCIRPTPWHQLLGQKPPRARFSAALQQLQAGVILQPAPQSLQTNRTQRPIRHSIRPPGVYEAVRSRTPAAAPPVVNRTAVSRMLDPQALYSVPICLPRQTLRV
jgi:hypothetical protein